MKVSSAMILAAGIGSRLAPLTDHCPKALVPVGDRPMLAHLALQLRVAKIDRLVVNAHHHARQLQAFVRDQKSELGEIGVSDEHDLLGTAGGIRHAHDLLGEGATLIWNGDILADLDIDALTTAHESFSSEVTLAVKFAEKNAGNVGIDENGNIVRLRNETTTPGEIRGGFFLGIHVIGKKMRDACPRVGCIIADVYLPAMRLGKTLRAFSFDGEFSDIGTPATYLDANRAWLASQKIPNWKSDDAVVQNGIDVRGSIVGARARITGTGTLDSCVVWPGTQIAVDSRLFRAILTPFGIVNLSV